MKKYVCSCKKWKLRTLSRVHAISLMKSRNLKIYDYIPEIYKKSKYQVVYNPVIYFVNDSNLWVKTEYLVVHPPKFRKMSGKLKKKMNLTQGEIDGYDRKMRRIEFILKCSRCKQISHIKSICKMPLTT